MLMPLEVFKMEEELVNGGEVWLGKPHLLILSSNMPSKIDVVTMSREDDQELPGEIASQLPGEYKVLILGYRQQYDWLVDDDLSWTPSLFLCGEIGYQYSGRHGNSDKTVSCVYLEIHEFRREPKDRMRRPISLEESSYMNIPMSVNDKMMVLVTSEDGGKVHAHGECPSFSKWTPWTSGWPHDETKSSDYDNYNKFERTLEIRLLTHSTTPITYDDALTAEIHSGMNMLVLPPLGSSSFPDNEIDIGYILPSNMTSYSACLMGKLVPENPRDYDSDNEQAVTFTLLRIHEFALRPAYLSGRDVQTDISV
jgi:hypothetical protein